jgi:teichoic acid transport system ATP-binding protein
MFVRLAFAVAINIDPEILIVDEALSVGDVFFQLKCFKKFEEFKKQGKTILFVSHDLSSIERYCDRAVLMDHGRNVAEGVPIDIINKYKKIMTGMTVAEMEEQEKRRKEHLEAFALEGQSNEAGEMSEGQSDGKSGELAEGKVDDKSRETFNDQRTIGNDSSKRWSDHLDINPNLDEYGDGAAKLIDFGIFDEDGNITTTIIKGSTFTIRSKVEFKEDVDDPIFTYTFKTIKGQDITGTNTMYEKASVGLAKKGETYIASFTQEMNLQGGEYLLSMSCTSFVDGELVAHDRLYDVLNISVVSDKNTVGYYDMNSKVTIERVL